MPRRATSESKRFPSIVAAALSVWLLLAALSGYSYFSNRTEEANHTNTVQMLNDQIALLSNQLATSAQSGQTNPLAEIEAIKSKQRDVFAIARELDQKLPAGADIRTISISAQGQVAISAGFIRLADMSRYLFDLHRMSFAEDAILQTMSRSEIIATSTGNGGVSVTKPYSATFTVKLKPLDSDAEKKEQLNKNRSLAVLLITLLFLVLFATYSFVIKPSSGGNSDQQTEIDRLTGQAELLSKKLAEKKDANKSYSEASVQNALPLWDNTEQLLLDLQNIEQETGATTVTATFTPDSDGQQDAEEADGASLDNIGADTGSDTAIADNSSSAALGSHVKKLGVSAVIKGKYANVLRYVEKLQTMPRLITVDSFDVAKSSSADKPLSARITFTAYFDPSYKSLVKQMVLPYTE